MKPVNNLLHQVFSRLTALERVSNPGTRKNDTAAYWKCQCECGKTAIIRGYSLTSGKTQSCGCLKLEAPHLAQFQETIYSAHISAARVVWKRKNRYSELSFNEFYRLSQQNCFYCNSAPSIIVYGRQKNHCNPFTYNTLDRVNSSLEHTIDNVVPACLICNRGKLDRTLDQFLQHINDLINHIRGDTEEYRKLSLNNELIINKSYAYNSSVQGVYELSYNDGNLTQDQFYQLSQMKCYYCGSPPINCRKVYRKRADKLHQNFIYNGLDRVDNNLPHNYDNVVPCCKYCNSAKNNLTLIQFEDWINRLATKLG